MSRASICLTQIAALLLITGCGAEPTTSDAILPESTVESHEREAVEEVSVDENLEDTVEVMRRRKPDFTWSLEQVLRGYLEANDPEERAELVVNQDQDLVMSMGAGQFFDSSEITIHPPLKSELFPNESLEMFVDLPNAPSTIYVLTRGEDGYRVNLQLTNRHRDRQSLRQFVRNHRLEDASLSINVTKIHRDKASAEVRLSVKNDSIVHIQSLTAFIEAYDEAGEKVFDSKFSAADVAAGDTTDIDIKLDDVPQSASECRIRIEQVVMSTGDGETRDVSEYFID